TVVLALLAYFQIRAGRAQGEATLAIAGQTREAAERQWQPRVISSPWGEPKRGTGDDAAPDEMAVGYSLKNEGTGPAFNVEHAAELGGRLHPSPEVGQYRAMTAGEDLPPMRDTSGAIRTLKPLVVGVKTADWNDDVVYWTRFENLLGERFEVRNYFDLTRP